MADSLVSFQVLDDAGQTGNVHVFFDAGVTQAQLFGFANQFGTILDAAIDGKVTGARVTFDLTLSSTVKADPVADSTVRRGAQYSFGNTSRFSWGQYIPAWSLDLIDAGAIDTTNVDAQNLINAYVDGLTVSAVIIQPTNGYGADLNAFRRAIESFRKKG